MTLSARLPAQQPVCNPPEVSAVPGRPELERPLLLLESVRPAQRVELERVRRTSLLADAKPFPYQAWMALERQGLRPEPESP